MLACKSCFLTNLIVRHNKVLILGKLLAEKDASSNLVSGRERITEFSYFIRFCFDYYFFVLVGYTKNNPKYHMKTCLPETSETTLHIMYSLHCIMFGKNVGQCPLKKENNYKILIFC